MNKDILDPKTLGQRLKHLIKESGKSQESFAEKIYVEARTLRRWIKDGFDKISIAVTCADALGVDVKAILF